MAEPLCQIFHLGVTFRRVDTLSNFLSVCLSVGLLSVCLSFVCLYICLSYCLYICPSDFIDSHNLLKLLSIYLFVGLSVSSVVLIGKIIYFQRSILRLLPKEH